MSDDEIQETRAAREGAGETAGPPEPDGEGADENGESGANTTDNPASSTEDGLSPGASLGTDLLYCAGLAVGLPYLVWKYFKKPDSFYRIRQKFGHVPPRARKGKRILIHAVSVGEAIAAAPLVESLKNGAPLDSEVIVSVTTRTGLEIAAKKYGEENVVRFPLDFSWMVKRFLDRVRPDMVILMELEVWPNFVRECRARKTPVIVANGRMTERSYLAYRRFSPLLKDAFTSVDLILAQDDRIADRFRNLGVPGEKIVTTGSLKFDNLDFEPDYETIRELRKNLKIGNNVPVLLAGSIHPGEDKIVIDAYKKLLRRFKNLRLVLVPRHLPKVPDMLNIAREAALPVILKTELDENPDRETPDDPIIIVDVMGELKRLYRIAELVFIGGTFIDHGGQNFLEAVGAGVPVVSGPSLYNFRGAARLLEPTGALKVLNEPKELTEALAELLENEPEAARRGQRGKEALMNHSGALDSTVEQIRPFLEAVGWKF